MRRDVKLNSDSQMDWSFYSILYGCWTAHLCYIVTDNYSHWIVASSLMKTHHIRNFNGLRIGSNKRRFSFKCTYKIIYKQQWKKNQLNGKKYTDFDCLCSFRLMEKSHVRSMNASNYRMDAIFCNANRLNDWLNWSTSFDMWVKLITMPRVRWYWRGAVIRPIFITFDENFCTIWIIALYIK